MTSESTNPIALPSLAEIQAALEKLPYRHQLIEACLIAEEYVDATIELYLPNLRASNIKLSFEQKLCLFEYFLTDADKGFSKFPRMLQNIRNKVAHNRSYIVDKYLLAEFYEKLGQREKEMVDISTKNTFKKRGEAPVPFSCLDPSDQFLLLLIGFTAGLSVEISRGPFQFSRSYKKAENIA